MKTLARLSGKVYPDLNFSVGFVPPKEVEVEPKSFENKENWIFRQTGESFLNSCVLCPSAREIERKTHRSLRLDRRSKSSQRKTRYGLSGLTGYGRRMLRSGAAELERMFGHKRLGFITSTLPGFSKSILKKIAIHWADVQRRFFQKLKRYQEKRGYPTEYICCTEVQPNRYKTRQEFALHLHFVYVCKESRYSKKFTVHADQFRKMWREAVTEVLSLNKISFPSNISFGGSIHAVPIKKSLRRYLAKYLTDFNKFLKAAIDTGHEACMPRQWWSCNTTMKARIKQGIIPIDRFLCAAFQYDAGDFLEDGTMTWFNFIWIEWKGKERCIGCVGSLSEDYYQKLRREYREKKQNSM